MTFRRLPLPAALGLMLWWGSLLAASDDEALAPQDFAYGLPVQASGEAAAYRVTLPLEVYRQAVRPDLGDLRVFNADGAVVPHALERPRTDVNVRRPARPLPLFPLRNDSTAALEAVRVTIESGGTAVNVQAQGASGRTHTAQQVISSYIVDARSIDAPLSALLLSWPEDAKEYAGRVRIEASDDLASWRTIADALPVANLQFNGERLVERRVEFAPTQARYWRLAWVGDPAPFMLNAVQGEPAESPVAVERTRLTLTGTSTDQSGEFVFDVGAQLPVDRINIGLPEINTVVPIELLSRQGPQAAWRSVTKQGFYRLRGENGELRNGAVPIALNPDRHWLARVDMRGAGIGSGAPSLEVGWVPHELVFLARGAGPYVIAYGSAAAEPAEAVLNAIPRNVPVLRADTAAPRELGGALRLQPPPPPFPWRSALLWAVLTAGVVLLGWMAYRLSRELE